MMHQARQQNVVIGHSHHNSSSIGNILGGGPNANPVLNNQRYGVANQVQDTRFQSEADNKSVR